MVFRERLAVPLSWWVLAVVFSGTVLGVVGLSAGPGWGVGVAAGTLGIAVALFLSTAILITVDDHELRVGRAVIERTYIGRCRPLDAAAADLRGGVDADVRAHLVLRPYIATAVEIEIVDADDPVPYWLVSTRKPARLAAVLAPVSASGSLS